jgi:hypothetical protein
MSSVARLVPPLQHLFTTVAEEAAQTSRCCQRASGTFTGATLCQTLVFGVLEQPLPHLSTWCQAAAGLGIEVKRQAIDQRLNARTASMLEQVLEQAIGTKIAGDAAAIPLLARFHGVYLQDCTQLQVPAALAACWPGCGNQTGETAMVKLGIRLEMSHGILQGPVVVPGRTDDRATLAQLAPLPPGSLRIADLGFFDLQEFARLDEAESYYLSRLQMGTAVFTPEGTRLGLSSLLTPQAPAVVDRPILLGQRARLACRLIAVRVPPEVAAERRHRMREEAKRRNTPIDPERLALADWTILVTNVPATLLRPLEALVLLRVRWQIELLFKGWKSGSRQLGVWRTTQPDKLRCEFFAKLLAAVVEHWLLAVTCWEVPDRSLEQARQAIRAFAPALLGALASARRLRSVLGDLARRCQTACHIPSRSRHPAAFQLLRAPQLLEDWLVA